jgi:hypothetical protein
MRYLFLALFLLLPSCADDAPVETDAAVGCSRPLPEPASIAPADRLARVAKAAGERTVLVPLLAEDTGRRLRVYDTLANGDWVSGSFAFVGPEPERELLYGSPGIICALDFAAIPWPVPPGADAVLLDLNPSSVDISVTAVLSDE